jgi:hypothetical protein
MSVTLTLATFLAGSPAHAGACDHLLHKADTAQGAGLAEAFGELAECDQLSAEEHYTRFMANTTDVDSLVGLSQTAIRWEVWQPVWHQIGKIKDYSARDQVVLQIGGKCTEEPKTIAFLQGAYFGLRNLDFQRWKAAFIACDNADLDTWLAMQVESPPKKQFDEKYGSLIDIYVGKNGPDALDRLSRAAIAAAEDGPSRTSSTVCRRRWPPTSAPTSRPRTRRPSRTRWCAPAKASIQRGPGAWQTG